MLGSPHPRSSWEVGRDERLPVNIESIIRELDELLDAPTASALKAGAEDFRDKVGTMDPSALPPDILEIIDDLAFDLAGYEPADHLRDDPSLLDEPTARAEIEVARQQLKLKSGS